MRREVFHDYHCWIIKIFTTKNFRIWQPVASGKTDIGDRWAVEIRSAIEKLFGRKVSHHTWRTNPAAPPCILDEHSITCGCTWDRRLFWSSCLAASLLWRLSRSAICEDTVLFPMALTMSKKVIRHKKHENIVKSWITHNYNIWWMNSAFYMKEWMESYVKQPRNSNMSRKLFANFQRYIKPNSVHFMKNINNLLLSLERGPWTLPNCK